LQQCQQLKNEEQEEKQSNDKELPQLPNKKMALPLSPFE